MSAYVEYKDLADLVDQFPIAFSSQNVQFYIWRTAAGLKRNTNFTGDYYGAYVANPARRPRSGMFGEIHLIESKIDSGYVAHEIQHFLFDWLLEHMPPKDETGERLAMLAEYVTRTFWEWMETQ